jgi:hypothetical protein
MAPHAHLARVGDQFGLAFGLAGSVGLGCVLPLGASLEIVTVQLEYDFVFLSNLHLTSQRVLPQAFQQLAPPPPPQSFLADSTGIAIVIGFARASRTTTPRAASATMKRIDFRIYDLPSRSNWQGF